MNKYIADRETLNTFQPYRWSSGASAPAHFHPLMLLLHSQLRQQHPVYACSAQLLLFWFIQLIQPSLLQACSQGKQPSFRMNSNQRILRIIKIMRILKIIRILKDAKVVE
jgi:hypothetical protein